MISVWYLPLTLFILGVLYIAYWFTRGLWKKSEPKGLGVLLELLYYGGGLLVLALFVALIVSLSQKLWLPAAVFGSSLVCAGFFIDSLLTGRFERKADGKR